MDVKIEDSWKTVLKNEFSKPYFLEAVTFLKTEKALGKTIYPPGSLIFNAFNTTPFHLVKVVLLGQDPYHGTGQAHGLSFSVPSGVKPPPSLMNIFKELHDDVGIPFPSHGNLTKWAEQGVLLLNASLSVRENEPLSHSTIGWTLFTDSVISKISAEKKNVVFLLWGKYAQQKQELIDETKHLVLKAAHPSPFSAYSGFFGCRHFSKTNEYLVKKWNRPHRLVDWITMRIFKEIFARIWALWAALVFISTMLVFLIPFLLFCYFKKDPAKTIRFTAWSKIWIDTFLFLIASPLKIKGRENFVPGENYIVLCNHNSFMDVPITTPAIPGGNKTIAKVELSRIPLFGMLYKTGSILVDRKSDTSRKESFAKMKEVLNMGLHMCIYPEGTRNKTSEPLKSFHNGAFRLAVDTRKSLIPALIFNTRKVLPADKTFYAIPHKLEIHFLEPLAVDEGETAEALRERVFTLMSDYYKKNKK